MISPSDNESSATVRLAAARLKQWHQQGEALLTIENARSFLNAAGLVLFTSRPQIAAPAPSFVEAVLGAPNASPTLAQVAQARELLARLVEEGLAVPLNLLGVGSGVGQSGDMPDFIASAQVFSYIFTLRGDKAWKQPPQPAGPSRFSYLAIAAHEALTRRGAMTAYDLAGELGKEVTESAVLRALGELWMHLRVLPLPQLDGRATLWELAGTRLSKQIKAGANAGLPTALSALISLYLGQAAVASEDEVESFLSPLAARSRIRNVIHALVSARQLDTVAIEGKTVLHIGGAPPAFLAEEMPPQPAAAVEGIAGAAQPVSGEEDMPGEPAEVESEPSNLAAGQPPESSSRIAKFTPQRRPATRELAKAKPAKPARKPFGETRKPLSGTRKSFGEKKPFAPRDGKGRPPSRDAKSARPFGEGRTFRKPGDTPAARRPGFDKKRFAAEGSASRPRFERREQEGGKPERERRPFVRGGEDRAPRKSFDRTGGAPRKPFDRSADRTARKPFVRSDRPDRSGPSGANRPPRKPFLRAGEDRPPRKPFDRAVGGAPRKPFARSSGGRPEGRTQGERKPFRRFDDRPAGGRPTGPNRFAPHDKFGSGGASDRRESPRPFGRSKPFAKRDDSGEGTKSRPGGFGARKPFSKSGASGKPFGGKDRSEGGRSSRAGGGAKFGGTGFGAKSFGPKKFTGKPGGKPSFGKSRGPRKSKPSQGEPEA